MRYLIVLGFISLFSLLPVQRVHAQYASPTSCPAVTCYSVDPTPPDCQAIVGPGSFPVCNHTNCNTHWSCTNATYNSCTDANWSQWSGCVNGAVGETRYCTNSSCCDNAAQERACSPNPTGPTGNGNPTNPPANTSTPTPPAVGTIRVRAVRVAGDTSCAAIKAVPTTDGEIDLTQLQFTGGSASQPTAQTQSGANYAQFPSLITGSYTVDATPPTANWSYARACWTDDTAGTTGESLSHTLVANHTLRWDIGYTSGTQWVQTEGGDVYASGSLRSFVPAVVPRTFNTDGAGGYPGVVQYGTGCDFDNDPLYNGCTVISNPTNPLLVSSQNWQVNSSRTTTDFYEFFYRRFGAPTVATTTAPFDNLSSVAMPSSNCTATTCSPYYVVGDMTTSAAGWTIGATDKIVILVNGNLTIGGNITITPGGFLAFIVNGNISVSPTIGRTSTGTVPNVMGVYVASNADHSATFSTGASSTTNGNIVRFVGKGMFVADNFLLERDLQSFGVTNTGASAELFTYDPQLLLTMPESMKDLAITWQEVAP